MTSPQASGDHRGQQPVASPMARWIVMILGVVLLALAGAAGRELWIRYTDTNQQSWARVVTDYIGTMSYEPWMFYAGILCCVLALFLLWFVFKPRFKTHQQLIDTNQSVWMRPIDIARMSTAAAENIPGVQHAQTTVKPRLVHLSIVGDSNDSTLVDRVGRTVGPLIGQVVGSPELKITVSSPEEEQS
ncbi:hypothetical protein ACFSSC_01415 [Corynebacterium mendelii]|uniref:Alkaline shock response membrane anchor protein AmaP n=1 Tax=Corynebacterium mendelii TaxID=2765362 RepID=A0A939E168_9CORY|nr:hypothetical protein [Corynebacterium mendelii]MBN9643938.1 hypothetical protein [Corynebacterium mendelii]